MDRPNFRPSRFANRNQSNKQASAPRFHSPTQNMVFLSRLKIYTVCFIFSLVCLSFFSCAQQNSSYNISKANPRAKKITIWHWMTDREEIFQELARKYEALTGIRVVFELYAPSDAYSQKVRAAAQAETLPDIYGILADKRDFASFIKAGHAANLSQEMAKDNGAWSNSFFSKAIAVNEFLPDNKFGVTPGIYGVPIDVMNIQMLYNKSLFKKAGLDPNKPPQTWEEFLQAGRKLKQAGIQGLVSGWGETWMIDCFISNYAFNIMGEQKVFATIRGEVPYTDLDWVKVFGLFKQLADEGMLASGIVTMINKNAEQNFANERAAFAFNGSWCVNVYEGMNPGLEYGAMFPPSVSSKYPMMIWGGAGSSFIVNDRSQNKDEAVKFLKWLTADAQQIYLSRGTNNLPANKNCISSIPDILSEFAKKMNQTTHPNVWPVQEFPAVIERMDKGVQSIIIGEKTPEELSREIQSIKENELAKARKKEN
ncbi:MAG: extracellular solute-binding protein [Candidatus Omnitrophica bacterium]|nr:extracellular solute-binding protein [Candidatus Omnitrophota bacterium]MDD5352992.1 extracellular solute-binding protein [Candidatus Omnitrophota bacterium]MDD5550591.1 extracellular solute-binding protein [Candidatus Omnitrophota bacterium]